MHHLLITLATTPAPAPTPSLRPGLSQDQVTPGLLGFLLTAFIVVLTALLITDMVRRIRRVRYRAQVEEQRLAAAEAAQGQAAPAAPGDPVPGANAAGAPAGEAAAGDGAAETPGGGTGGASAVPTENNGDAGSRSI